nr:hypothetical protein [uncultured bacterium]
MRVLWHWFARAYLNQRASGQIPRKIFRESSFLLKGDSMYYKKGFIKIKHG